MMMIQILATGNAGSIRQITTLGLNAEATQITTMPTTRISRRISRKTTRRTARRIAMLR